VRREEAIEGGEERGGVLIGGEAGENDYKEKTFNVRGREEEGYEESRERRSEQAGA